MRTDPQTTPEQLRYALEAFGIKRIDGKTIDQHEHAFGIGVLMAMAELVAQDLDRADEISAAEGYSCALINATRSPEEAAVAWARLVNQRLNRTALEMKEAMVGDGEAFSHVAGPAMLIASNTMAVANSELDEDRAKELVAYLAHNLKQLRSNFGILCSFLRSRGYRV